jgi:hypothetical protein
VWGTKAIGRLRASVVLNPICEMDRYVCRFYPVFAGLPRSLRRCTVLPGRPDSSADGMGSRAENASCWLAPSVGS